MVIIREAGDADKERLLFLLQKLSEKENADYDPLLKVDWMYNPIYQKEFNKNFENELSTTFLAEEDGIAIGFLMATQVDEPEYWSEKPNKVELDMMFIEEGHRGKGVGLQLMTEFKRWAKDKGYDSMKVTAYENNESAIRFYEREGFKKKYVELQL